MVPLVDLVEEHDRLRGPNAVDLLKFVERDVAEVFERRASDEQDEVEPARGHPQPLHAGQRAQTVAQVSPQTLSDVDHHECSDRETHGDRVDACGEPVDDPSIDQPVEPVVRSGAPDRQLLGKRRSRGPAVCTQCVDHLAVDVIQAIHETKVARNRIIEADRLDDATISHRLIENEDDGEMVANPIEPPQTYWTRREEIAALAAGIESPAVDIDYTDIEHGVWAAVAEALTPLWEQHGAAEVLHGRDRLALRTDCVPQLSEVSTSLRKLTGFEFRAVPGLVSSVEFFGGLGRCLFSSTQYVRWEGSPLYTPEPDVIHEVFGHANALACPELAELHRLAGRAFERVTDERARQMLADVFWFSAEFGVVRERDRVRAYGAGLLSSVGELDWFAEHADIRTIDIAEMATTAYDIDHYQPVLFAGDSIAHVLDVVGGFFDTATDETAAALIATR